MNVIYKDPHSNWLAGQDDLVWRLVRPKMAGAVDCVRQSTREEIFWLNSCYLNQWAMGKRMTNIDLECLESHLRFMTIWTHAGGDPNRLRHN